MAEKPAQPIFAPAAPAQAGSVLVTAVVVFRIPEACVQDPRLATMGPEEREGLVRELVARFLQEAGLDKMLTGVARSLFGHVAQIERARRSLGLPPQEYHFRH